jgi:hypothetical protein
VGTTVGVYPADSQTPNAPGAAAIATGVVAADGSLSITNAGILSGTTYLCAAQVGGVWQAARARSTLDTFDAGTATGTATTVSGSPNLSSVSASAGAFAVGQLITGRVPVAVLGLTVNPQTPSTGWAARLRQRRATAGTS